MQAKRAFLALLFVVILLLSSFPAAEAQRPCAEALTRCAASCTQRFSDGGFFSSFLTEGCYTGCNIGYVWCASSN
jgi:hypothetical protein